MPDYFPALAKAASLNASIILDLLEAGAQPNMVEIKKACAKDGYCDDVSIDLAVKQLLDDGLIVKADAAGMAYYLPAY